MTTSASTSSDSVTPKAQTNAQTADAQTAGTQTADAQDTDLRTVGVGAAAAPRVSFASHAPGRGRWLIDWRGIEPALSQVLPHLESLGFTVLTSYSGTTATSYQVTWEHTVDPSATNLEASFLASWTGAVEIDEFSELIGRLAITWADALLLRALARYLALAGLPHSRATISRTLLNHRSFTQALLRWFTLRHGAPAAAQTQTVGAHTSEPDAADPTPAATLAALPAAATQDALADVTDALEQSETLDADRIMRALLETAQAVTRTTFARREQGQPNPRLTLKLDSRALSYLPQPRPLTETFVYSAEVEGLHLRASHVARGGLRWSDRTDDFRTEVLALMKAQQVKNALIVPSGAKGAFITKRTGNTRNAGQTAYTAFVSGLLDITDNIVAGAIEPPAGTSVLDEPDPYLVVAADKGTATFSDLANSIAQDRGFWLGDAFASGGSHGYDHKAMGITARGAWISVREHLHRRGINADADRFTAVGIGDMSGDVFGNGVQLSPQLVLVAAFDHRHVFVDPTPDPRAAHLERARLAGLPGSSWADYTRDTLSPGGGVWPRTTKLIRLSPAARNALGLPDDQPDLSAQDLIQAILQAPVDLLYNGGVGTYIKASTETNAAAGDPVNDAVRVDAHAVRAGAVVEGGNLGLTQAARVELALAGVAVNADFIDNSAGVDTSDQEVNLKILLDPLVQQDRLDPAARDAVLRAAEADVARAVLDHNAQSVQAITAGAEDASLLLDQHGQVMDNLRHSAGLDRRLEELPSPKELESRRARGTGLTRPEIAVLLAWSKNLVRDELLASDLPDQPEHAFLLRDYFPPAVRDVVNDDDISRHRLAREIIATRIANTLVDEVGPGFLHRMEQRTGAGTSQTAKAYLTARRVIDADTLDAAVRAAALSHDDRQALRRKLRALLELLATRLARSGQTLDDDRLRQHRAGIDELVRALPDLTDQPQRREEYLAEAGRLRALGFDQASAARLAALPELTGVLDIVTVARTAEVTTAEAVRSLLDLEYSLDVAHLRRQLVDQAGDEHWTLEAKAVLRDEVDAHLNDLAVHGVRTGERLEHYRQVLAELARLPAQPATPRLPQVVVAAHALADLNPSAARA